MADREQSHTSKSGMDQKPQPNVAGQGAPTSGTKGQERDHGVRSEGEVGRDVPDQSKEKNTEIAVEAGHKGGEKGGAKR